MRSSNHSLHTAPYPVVFAERIAEGIAGLRSGLSGVKLCNQRHSKKTAQPSRTEEWLWAINHHPEVHSVSPMGLRSLLRIMLGVALAGGGPCEVIQVIQPFRVSFTAARHCHQRGCQSRSLHAAARLANSLRTGTKYSTDCQHTASSHTKHSSSSNQTARVRLTRPPMAHSGEAVTETSTLVPCIFSSASKHSSSMFTSWYATLWSLAASEGHDSPQEPRRWHQIYHLCTPIQSV